MEVPARLLVLERAQDVTVDRGVAHLVTQVQIEQPPAVFLESVQEIGCIREEVAIVVRAKDSDVGGIAQVQLDLAGLMGGADEEFVREVGDLLQEDADAGALVIELELGKGRLGPIVEGPVDDQEEHKFEIFLVAIGN